MLLAVYTLTHRELVRFVRQRNRVIGALVQPVIFWLLFGAGLHGSFDRAPVGGVSFMEYFVPGVLAMILLFTAIFSTISIIEDRREGFLQSVLVAPVSRGSLVLGKLLGGTLLAVLQGVLFLLLAVLAQGLAMDPLRAALLLGAMTLIAFALVGLGFLIAWRSESTQGFHAIMSVFLFPMWLLSGAFFPVTEGTPAVLAWVVAANPLTYGVALLRHALYLDPERLARAGVASPAAALGVTAAFAALMFVLARVFSARRIQGDLQ